MNYKIKIIICLVFILLIILITRICIYPYYNIVKIIGENDVSIKKGYGIVYKKNKKTYIVTNYHIVKDTNRVLIRYGFKEKVAKVINADEYEDIAILSVSNDHRLLVGPILTNNHLNDRVWTYNNGIKNNGYIRSKNQKVLVKLSDGNYLINTLQLDMNITKGDSGKPLYHGSNIVGMISMNNKKEKHTGYAMNMKQVLKVAYSLEKKSIKRPNLGVQLASSTNKEVLKKYKLKNYGLSGVIVTKNYDSKLLKKGDIIVSINNYRVKDIVHFKYHLFNNPHYKLLVYRDNKYIKIKDN